MHVPAQISETLLFEGEPLLMCATPLEPWLRQQGLELSNDNASERCLRGYLGLWKLHRAHLYLAGLRPFSRHGVLPWDGYSNEMAERSLSGLFPDARGPVCAAWFSGQLRCPVGRILAYRDGAYGAVHERDMLVDVVAGHVERIVFRHNDVELLPLPAVPRRRAAWSPSARSTS